MLNIAKSTASAWLTNIPLSSEAQDVLAKKQILGQYKSILIKKETKRKERETREKIAIEMLSFVKLTKQQMKIYCALLWWCEGNKDIGFVKFTNSDPTLI